MTLKHLYGLLILFGLAVSLSLSSCKRKVAKEGVILPFAGVDEQQVDSLLGTMSLQEKIGQMLIWAPSPIDSSKKEVIFQQVSKGRVGGLLLSECSVFDYLLTADSSTKLAPLPLFLASREKISLHNQFSELLKFPLPYTLASIDSFSLEKIFEKHYLQQCEALGVNLVIHPSIEPKPNVESGFELTEFGGNRLLRQEAQTRIFQSLQEKKILSVPSGFSDKAIIEVDSLRDSLFSHYFAFTNQGLGALFLDDKIFQSDSLKERSQRFLKEYLEESFNFHGLIVAQLDRLESPATKIAMGADLFITDDAQKAFYSILKLIERGRLSESDLNNKVRLILRAKAWIYNGSIPEKSGSQERIPNPKPAEPVAQMEYESDSIDSLKLNAISAKAEDLEHYFKDENWEFLARHIYERSVIVASNPKSILPLSNSIGSRFLLAVHSSQDMTVFQNTFEKFAALESKRYPPGPVNYLYPPAINKPLAELVQLILLDNIEIDTIRHAAFLENLQKLSGEHGVVILNFGNPVNLKFLPKDVSILQVFERNDITESYAAQLVFGAVSSHGKLPVSVSNEFPVGTHFPIPQTRMGYALPETVGISGASLSGINAIAETAIENGVFPGCQVLFAKDGKIILNRSFGTHSTRDKVDVATSDLYDIASVTKVSATTIALMKLVDEGRINISKPLGSYLNIKNNPELGAVTIESLLRHTSGLPSQMPISSLIRTNSVPNRGCNDLYCRKKNKTHTVQVADQVYLKKSAQDSLWERVFRAKVNDNKRFRYSDVNFFLLQKLVEEITNLSLDTYVRKSFYEPLGLQHTTFNPLNKFKKSEIIPTEQDRKWRRTLVHGFVHDPAAAILGGVGGNAGVFSNAEDLAVIFQMLLNKGNYAGVQYVNPATVEEFTYTRRSKRRGLGFDIPAEHRYPAYSRFTSKLSYGHTGFTGTCVWVDPANHSIFVFLSNRVNPNASNSKIFSEAVRSRIHTIFYEAQNSFTPRLPELTYQN